MSSMLAGSLHLEYPNIFLWQGQLSCQHKPWSSLGSLRARPNERAEKEKPLTQIEPENQNSKTYKEANAMKDHQLFFNPQFFFHTDF